MPSNAEIASTRFNELMTMTRLISPDNLATEQELMTSKWFAYRFMSPLAATLHFGAVYQSACKNYVRTNIDLELSKKVRGQELSIPAKPNATFSQLWKARAFADTCSMPYEEYLSFCFEFAGRRARKKPPRPNQLQPNEKTAIAWHAEFNRFIENRFPLIMQRIELPAQYRVEAYQNLAPQNALRHFLLEWMKREKAALHQQIDRWFVSKRLLPIRDVLADHSREMRKSAIATVRSSFRAGVLATFAEPFERLHAAEMWPSCFGVPYAKSPAKDTCTMCALAPKCAFLGNAILEKTGRDPKSEDPERDRIRLMTRERVRNHRQRRKMLGVSAS